LQCVAGCCSVLQCVAVCCSALQCVAVCCSVLQCVAVCCSALQYVAVCYSALQCVAVCCSVLQCAAVCCSALQSVLHCGLAHTFLSISFSTSASENSVAVPAPCEVIRLESTCVVNKTLQYTATQGKTQCNTLQRLAK